MQGHEGNTDPVTGKRQDIPSDQPTRRTDLSGCV